MSLRDSYYTVGASFQQLCATLDPPILPPYRILVLTLTGYFMALSSSKLMIAIDTHGEELFRILFLKAFRFIKIRKQVRSSEKLCVTRFKREKTVKKLNRGVRECGLEDVGERGGKINK
jgi:hypothetical protein